MTFPCSDPTEASLRSQWHSAKAAVEVSPTQENQRTFAQAHRSLSEYLWNRVQAQVEEDRKRHPRAKRNQPVPARDPTQPDGRVLP